jgi:hypothetical protein
MGGNDSCKKQQLFYLLNYKRMKKRIFGIAFVVAIAIAAA